MRSITCINNETGKSITISEDSFAPLFLAGLEGVYSADYDVAVSDNTMSDGGTYQGSRANTRNIVITAIDQPNNVYNQPVRDIVYTIFKKGELGTFIYHEDNVPDRKIDYYTESVKREDGGHRPFTISLICTEPSFRDLNDTNVYMANWVGQFEFVHEFAEEGEEIGIRMTERIVNIINNSATKEIGFTAIIETTATTTNPVLTRVESQERIALNGLTISAGDQLIITTERNNKHVRLVHEGVTTEVNQYLTEDSEFFNILSGENHIVYNASAGVDNMSVLIRYSFKYDGA